MKIVFLDIDGVLQPYNSENRFYSDKRIVTKLSETYHIDYSQYSFYDVAAVYYDWDSQAIARIRYILDMANAKIIVSSDWRSKNQPDKMRDLLRIHALEKYYFADNIIIDTESSLLSTRVAEINDSLNKYEISNFLVLDDMKGLETFFPNHSVITDNVISISDMHEAIKILKR